MRLILHIGRPKTGTTSIQRFFRENRRVLSAAGFLLFDGLGGANNVRLAAYFAGGRGSGFRMMRARAGVVTPEGLMEHLAAEAPAERVAEQVRSGSSDHHTAIITSEQFAGIASPEALHGLAEWVDAQFDDVRVVAFVRDQVEGIVSGWSTALRSGAHESLSDHIRVKVDQPGQDLFAFANRWSAAFGPENLAFHVYRAAPEDDVRRTFAAAHLTEVEDLAFAAQRFNPALTRPHAEALRLINRAVPYWPPTRSRPNQANLSARRFIDRCIAGRGPAVRPTESDAARIRTAWESSNRAFSEKYLAPGEAL